MPKIKAFVMSKPGYYIKIYTSSYIKTDIRKSTRPYTWESTRTYANFYTNYSTRSFVTGHA